MDATRLLHPRWAAVAIENDTAHVVADLAPRGYRTYLVGALMDDPADLLDVVARTGLAPEITVIVDRVPLPAFYRRPPITTAECLAEMVKRAAGLDGDGWKPSAAGLELGSGWITWTRDKNTPVVHMGIRPMMDADKRSLIQPDDDAATIAHRLQAYAKLVGASYRATAGVAGLGLLRNLYDRPVPARRPVTTATGSKAAGPVRYVPRPEPRFIWNAPDKIVGAGDLSWRRVPSAEERAGMRNVFAYDTRASYLAAAQGARLGWHAPKQTGAITWDPAQSGLYRVRVPVGAEWADARRGVPVVNPNRINSDRTTWVAGPVLAFLSERGYALPEIVDSWTCSGVGGRDVRMDITGSYLRDWAERLRDATPDAVTAGDPHLRRAIKDTYAHGVGLLARPGGRVYRQDWAATIIDEARCRLLRKIYGWHDSTGQWPLQVKTDCVWYAANTDDAVGMGVLIGIGPFIGNLRYEPEHSGTMADYITQGKRQAAARRQRKATR